mmetsp:Transcript_78363/g.143437  ORF Transcript_78363/g.143437 Transcript_78363/m.143437 type:complete len:301 (+) Transcript_78363:116-1018(+)
MFEDLERVNNWLAQYLGPSHLGWDHDWRFWVGLTLWILVWIKWLFIQYEEKFYIKFISVFGFDLLTLIIVENFRSSGMRVLIALCLVQAVFKAITMRMYEPPILWKEEGFTATSFYESLDKPFLQCFTIFLGQLVSMLFIMHTMSEELEAIDFEKTRLMYLFWLTSVVNPQMATMFLRGDDSVVGGKFPINFWEDLWKKGYKLRSRKFGFNGDSDDCFGKPIPISKGMICSRALMDFLVNGFMREIIAYLVPIVLMNSSDPLAFVMHSVALNWVCTIDDMTGQDFRVEWESEDKELDQSI